MPGAAGYGADDALVSQPCTVDQASSGVPVCMWSALGCVGQREVGLPLGQGGSLGG
jgi:hypothetical protein